MNDRLDTLIESYLAGTASPAELAELQELLESDPAARRRLVEHSTLDGTLHDLLKEAPRRRLPTWPWIAATVAAAILAAVLIGHPRPDPAPAPPSNVVHKDPPAPPPVPSTTPVPKPPRIDPPPTPPPSPTPEPPAPPPDPTPSPTPTPEPSPSPTPKPLPPTRPAIAKLTDPSGTRDLLDGAEFDTKDAATLEYPDGTRFDLAAETSIRQLGAASLRLEKGTASGEIARRGFVIGTPRADATVQGTKLRLVVTAATTSLEVTRGSVKFSREGRSIEVKAGQCAVANAATIVGPLPLPKDEVVLSLDYGDGKPEWLKTGTLERGPGGRLCIAGEAGEGVSKLMIVGGAKGLFVARGDEEVSFDYWVDAKAHKINLNVLNRTQGRTQEMVVPGLIRGKWARATLKLADFGGPGAGPKEGEQVANLYLQAVSDTNLRVHIDNVKITRPRREK